MRHPGCLVKRALAVGVVAAATVTVTVTAANGVAGRPAVAAAGCRVSGALFASPFAAGERDDHAVTVLRSVQRGTWTGFAYNGIGGFALLSWRPGQRARVLDRRSYQSYSIAGSVKPVGVTPAGAVVANLQARTASRYWAFGYVHGRRFPLRTPSTWRNMAVLAVTGQGRILGYGLTGWSAKPVYHLVSWHDIHAAPRHLLDARADARSVVADQHGDFAWGLSDNNGRTAFTTRLPSGAVRTLAPPSPGHGGIISSAAGSFVFAVYNGHVVRWNTAAAPPTGAMQGGDVASDRAGPVTTAGAAGDVVSGADHRYFTVSGQQSVAIPGEYYADGPDGEAVGPYHRLAFTGGRDRLAHFMTCS